jgi:hypothetical protein
MFRARAITRTTTPSSTGLRYTTLPGLNDPYFDTLFDYAAEDAYLNAP